MLRSFGAFPIFDKLASRKWRVLERNVVEFGARGGGESVLRVQRGLLTVACLRSFRRHSVHFRILMVLYLENGRP